MSDTHGILAGQNTYPSVLTAPMSNFNGVGTAWSQSRGIPVVSGCNNMTHAGIRLDLKHRTGVRRRLNRGDLAGAVVSEIREFRYFLLG